VLTLFFLMSIFVIFTAFEMWKFAGAFEGGVGLLTRYLGYLVPFVYLQVSPSAAMIATLATYVIKSRNNEVVTWTSAGQSVYRLLIPCFILMLALGGVNWWIQEGLVPRANRLQDQTRSIIRNRGVATGQSGKYWVASEKRIYSFELDDATTRVAGQPQRLDRLRGSDNEIPDLVLDSRTVTSYKSEEVHIASLASFRRAQGRGFEASSFSGSQEYRLDTYFRETPPGSLRTARQQSHSGERRKRSVRRDVAGTTVGYQDRLVEDPEYAGLATTVKVSASFASDNEIRELESSRSVRNLTVYEFADNGENLQFIYRADRAEWMAGRVRFSGSVERSDLQAGKIQGHRQQGGELAETLNPFAGIGSKPNHLGTSELRLQLDQADSEADRRTIGVTLAKRYTTPFLPLVIAMFTAPFALNLSRKGKAATVGYAVFLWLMFTGTSSVFEQFGVNGSLAPTLAVWSPLAIFSFLGIYLLSRIRT
jgi:lipopolysaccharide export LptBFGC system permease protein LptF